MSHTMRKGKAVMVTDTGAFQEGNPVLTDDLVMAGMHAQLSHSPQDGSESTANANAQAAAYRDRILEAAGRSRRLRKA